MSKVVIKNISRNYGQLKADGEVVIDIEPVNLYDIEFLWKTNEQVFQSATSIKYAGDLSFTKAEELIVNLLEDGDN